ncbi:hypothetical protein EJD97_006009 [Solanum chilense]|uniref:Uncharacterized protein n=1 Tax=Solanum chilense TaxID=4083 RepID=A0A6N2BRI5_SOLCI|nr:hypothetical protein EJD97_006009 [Solanum chilense]
MLGDRDNNKDALQTDILFFIHTFVYSQLGEMETAFTEIDYSNIHPTPKEISSLDLPDHNNVLPTQTDSTIPDGEYVHPGEVPGFEDFSIKPPENLLRRLSRDSIAGTTPPPRKRVKVVHPHKYNLSRLSQPQKQPD